MLRPALSHPRATAQQPAEEDVVFHGVKLMHKLTPDPSLFKVDCAYQFNDFPEERGAIIKSKIVS
jgi:hypothetical protein